ncbi:MAG: FKBP-type peptidyl-prolyl cis-trans isomerase [bacterium]
MSHVKNGDTVKIHYTGKLEDGTVFDSSVDREPLEFKIGDNQVIKGIEKAIVGMNQDESKTVTISSDEAYGPYRQDMILQIPKDKFPQDIHPELGKQLQIQDRDGHVVEVTITQVSEKNITLDGNHPLAGKNLVFDIQLVGVN